MLKSSEILGLIFALCMIIPTHTNQQPVSLVGIAQQFGQKVNQLSKADSVTTLEDCPLYCEIRGLKSHGAIGVNDTTYICSCQ